MFRYNINNINFVSIFGIARYATVWTIQGTSIMKRQTARLQHGVGARTLQTLEVSLRIGDFRTALQALDRFIAEGILPTLSKMPLSDVTRGTCSAYVAELFFYQGENGKACELLEPYVAKPDLLLMSKTMPSRAKLQLSEYYYSLRQFQQAIVVAEDIAKQCAAQNDLIGVGESLYYVQRAYSRVPDYEKIDHYHNEALEHFARVGFDQSDATLRVEWRIGQVLLVSGFAHYRAGDLTKATALLCTARWLLRKTGDFLNIANVEQSFGCILRSKGVYDESLRALEYARRHYETVADHVNLSRVAMNIGRTYLGIGDAKQAKTCLQDAYAIAQRIHHSRQSAEVLIWLSWLYQTDDCLDLKEAERCAQEAIHTALKAEVKSDHAFIEGKLALGHCRVHQQMFKRAQDNFMNALDKAQELAIPKLEMKAHLSLAELYCIPAFKDLHKAVRHHEKVQAMCAPHCSQDLCDRADMVWDTIRASRDKIFVVTADQIVGEGVGLKEVERKFQAWALERALEATRGRRGAMADMLKLSRPGLDKMQQRLASHALPRSDDRTS